MSESRPTTIAVTINEPRPAPLNRTETRKLLDTCPIPAEIVEQGRAAVLHWLAQKLQEEACNEKK